MKKIIVSVLAAVFLLFVFAGCGQSGNGNFKTSEEKAGLVLNKKYIQEGSVSQDLIQKQRYYVFLNGNKGISFYDYQGTTFEGKEVIENYTITFRYYLVEDTLHCFFDSVIYGENHNQGNVVRSDWNMTFLPCEKFLMSTGGTYYFNEDFLKNEIPNFGK